MTIFAAGGASLTDPQEFGLVELNQPLTLIGHLQYIGGVCRTEPPAP